MNLYMKVATLILLLVTVLLIFANAAIERDTERIIEEFCKEQKKREETKARR